MRRALPILVVALAAIGGALLWLRGPSAPAAPAPAAAPAARAAGAAAPPPSAAPPRAPAPAFASVLRGRVLTASGEPAAGARVHLTRSSPPAAELEADADAAGAFAFTGLAAGTYALGARRGGFAAQPITDLPLGEDEELRELVLTLGEGALLEGAVRDLRTGEGVVGARVTVGPAGAQASTGLGGAFRFPALPPGRHVLAVSAEGYAPRSEVVALAAGGGQDLTVWLDAQAALSGRVTRPDGSGVPGARIFAEPDRLRGALGEVIAPAPVGVSGEDGAFLVEVPLGRLRVFARAEGRAPSAPLATEPVPGRTLGGLVLVLPVGGAIAGRVVRAGGKPVQDGRVAVLDLASGDAVAEAAVGGDGRFRATGIPGGSFAVVADAARARATARVQLEEGEEKQVTLTLGAASIAGRVVDGAGRPAPGALVRARPVGLGDAAGRSAVAGKKGEFALDGLDGQLFEVAARSGDAFGEARAEPGAQDVVVTIAAGGRVHGFVTTARGDAATDFTLVAEPEAPRPGLRASVTHVVSPKGELDLGPLAAGRWRLTASAPGATPSAPAVARVESGRVAEVALTLGPARRVCGTVVDRDTHAPVPGAFVSFMPDVLWRPASSLPAHTSTQSGADGAFCLVSVPADARAVFAVHGEDRRGHADLGGDSVTVTLEPGGGHPGDFAGVGLVLGPRDGRVFAQSVFEGGPAFAAGVRAGDELLAVDGRPVAGLGVQQVVELIRGEAGTPVTLTLARDGTPYTVAVPRVEVRF